MISLLKIVCSTCIYTFLFSSLCGQENIKERMFGDIDFIKNTLKTQYTPLEWKSNYSGWDLDAEVVRAKTLISNTPDITVKGYQHIVKNFLNTANDYHVAIRFYSTESATLPFRVKRADGKYFFTYIDRSQLSPAIYPIKEGDELISFDGRPIAEVIEEFKDKEVGGTSEAVSHAIAEVYFTNRFGAEGHEVPKGPVMLTVKSKHTGKVSSYQLVWKYMPEQIKNPFGVSSLLSYSASFGQPHKGIKSQLPLKDHPIFQKMMLSAHSQNFAVNNPKACSDDLGARQSFIPPLGKRIWEPHHSTFHAYLFETPSNKKVGYIRIPHYLNFGNECEDFKCLIDFFQQYSDALIIDQINNPGGRLFYVYALISMLIDQPASAPRHRISLTQKEVSFAIEVIPILESIQTDEEAQAIMGDIMEGNKVTFQTAQFFLNYLRFIVDEWNSGKIITSSTYLWGVDCIHPHPEVRYTKPLLVLINSLDFSGGDFFAAILQDSKRATLLGSQTAGAGGFVLTASFPNIFGIESFTYTASLAERTNNQVIENLGVTPDVPYEISADDLQNNYREYSQKILDTIDSML